MRSGCSDRAGVPPARGGPVRLDDFLRSTWLPHKRRQVRATTAYRYAWFVEHYVAPAIGHVPLRRLRADHLDDLYDRLATTGGRHGDGLAPKTVLEVHMILRAALDLAVQRHLLDHNVAHSAHGRRRRSGTAPARAWTAAELALFLSMARGQRLYPALHLAAHTGMRRGEIAGLKWADLDRSTTRVSVRRTVQSLAGRPVEFDVKTRTSRRCIDLDPATITELDRWRRRLRLDDLPHGPDDWMFCNRRGRFLNPESLSQLFDRIVDAASCPGSGSTTCATPMPRYSSPTACHQGGVRTPRSRPPGVHDAHLPAPPSRHERHRRRAVRHLVAAASR